MSKTVSKRLPGALWALLFFLVLLVGFLAYSHTSLSSKIARSNAVSVLITTYSSYSKSETQSFRLTAEDPRYAELSALLCSLRYRRCIDQNPQSHDLAQPGTVQCLNLKFFADEEFQCFLELWSDGVLWADEENLSLWFSGTDPQTLLQQLLEILDSP